MKKSAMSFPCIPNFVPCLMVPCALVAGAAAQEASHTASLSKGSGAARVLQVGTYRGKTGAFSAIQAAVNAAKPGDWILIGPGEYHEQGSREAGVWVTTPGLDLRGMDRNAVVVDGTLPGSSRCSAEPQTRISVPPSRAAMGLRSTKRMECRSRT